MTVGATTVVFTFWASGPGLSPYFCRS